MTDFFDIARPRVEALAVALQEEHDLSTEQVADSLLACACALAAGSIGEARTAATLAALAGRYAAAFKAKAEPPPLN